MLQAMRAPTYELTVHAVTVLTERQIDIAWVERVLARPQRVEDDEGDPELSHAIGRIPEHGNRVLRVVYNASVNPIRVVTAYFDRRERGKP